jgi:hypothetical protein
MELLPEQRQAEEGVRADPTYPPAALPRTGSSDAPFFTPPSTATSFFPSHLLPRALPPGRARPTAASDARGEARDRCRPSSFARRERLHMGDFCRCAPGSSWR